MKLSHGERSEREKIIIFKKYMAEKIKKASPYFLILVLVGLVIAFNFWSSLDKNLWDKYVKADTGEVGSSVSVGNAAPVIETVNVYGDGVTTLDLIEGSTIDLMASVDITDENGCLDIRDGGGVEAIFFTSDEYWTPGSGATCNYDENNCYDGTVVSCSYASCVGNTASYECVVSASQTTGLWYFADATTGTGSSVSGAWEVTVWASDSYNDTVESSSCNDFADTASNQLEINLYSAIDVEQGGSDSIVYGTDISPGSTNKAPQVGVRNTGNRGVDIIIEEVGSMSLNGQDDIYINTKRQQYAAFDFIVTDNGVSLSADNLTTVLDLNLPQRGKGDDGDDPYTSVSDDQLYFGIDIPVNQAVGSYKGSVSYTSIPD